MNTKPICIASAAASFFVACALEGDGLTIGQAVAVLVPAMMLLVWSFYQTNWYDPVEEEREDMKVEVGCALDIVGCVYENTIEVPDDLTDKEVDEEVREEIFGHFDWWYVVLEGGEEKECMKSSCK